MNVTNNNRKTGATRKPSGKIPEDPAKAEGSSRGAARPRKTGGGVRAIDSEIVRGSFGKVLCFGSKCPEIRLKGCDMCRPFRDKKRAGGGSPGGGGGDRALRASVGDAVAAAAGAVDALRDKAREADDLEKEVVALLTERAVFVPAPPASPEVPESPAMPIVDACPEEKPRDVHIDGPVLNVIVATGVPWFANVFWLLFWSMAVFSYQNIRLTPVEHCFWMRDAPEHRVYEVGLHLWNAFASWVDIDSLKPQDCSTTYEYNLHTVLFSMMFVVSLIGCGHSIPWPRVTKRVKSVSYYADDGSDYRAESIRLKDAKYGPSYAEVEVSDVCWYGNCVYRVVISLELLSQIATARNMDPQSSVEDTRERLYLVASRFNSVKLNRYEALFGHFTVQNTVDVATLLHEANIHQRKMQGFLGHQSRQWRADGTAMDIDMERYLYRNRSLQSLVLRSRWWAPFLTLALVLLWEFHWDATWKVLVFLHRTLETLLPWWLVSTNESPTNLQSLPLLSWPSWASSLESSAKPIWSHWLQIVTPQ